MLYVGSELAAVHGSGIEPALLDLALPVSARRGDPRGVRLGITPSYASLSPSSRRSYLAWLAGGRSEPAAFGYLALFFCGLERRLLSDELDVDRGRGEAAVLIAEVERLKRMDAPSWFAQRAEALVIFARACFGLEQSAVPPVDRSPADSAYSWRRASRFWSTSLTVAIGLRLQALRPITAEWAQAWFEGHPKGRTLSHEEARLFRLRFDRARPDGFWQAPARRCLATYRALSTTFGPEHIGVRIDVPDITRLRKPMRLMSWLAEPYLARATLTFSFAELAMHLMAVVAWADGAPSHRALAQLEDVAREFLGLTEEERAKLAGNAMWLATSKPTMAGVKKRAGRFSEAARDRLATCATSMVDASGPAMPKQVNALRKVFVALELAPDSVYDRLHDNRGSLDVAAWGARSSATSMTEPTDVTAPVIVQDGESPAGYMIPQPAPAPAFALDASRLETKRRGTAEVSRLLADVFNDDDGPASRDVEIRADDNPERLLRQLPKKPTLERAEFESLTRAIGLLPNAAYDQVNEAALDTCDAPLLAGEDPVHVDLEILEEMLS